jgi:hypothetical protein
MDAIGWEGQWVRPLLTGFLSQTHMGGLLHLATPGIFTVKNKKASLVVKEFYEASWFCCWASMPVRPLHLSGRALVGYPFLTVLTIFVTP